LLVCLVALAALLRPASLVRAQEIPELTGQLTDLAGALPAQHAEVDAALYDLRSNSDVRLYVLFVRSNDGLSAADFAREVWETNGLGGRDVLFVVATGDETAQFWNAGGIENLTDAELRDVQDRIVGPLLAGEAYGDAVVAAADGIAQAEATPANPGPEIPRLSGSITDLIGVLAGNRTAPEAAIRRLARDENIDYFVLIVDEAPDSLGVFADDVARRNNLGGNDVLLVIYFRQEGFFTQHGSAFWRGAALPEITLEELSDAEIIVGHNVNDGFDLAGAIVDTAEALADARHAEEIPLLQSNITDRTGVLDGQHERIQDAVDTLVEATGVNFFALFVKTTGNQPMSDFAGRVVDKNQRLRGKYVLLTVAVDDRTDVISKDQVLSEVTRDEILGLLTTEVDPLLARRDYVGAVLAAIAGIERGYLDLTPTPSPPPDFTGTPGATVTAPAAGSSDSADDGGGGFPVVPALVVGGAGAAGTLFFASRLRRRVTHTRQARAARSAQLASIEALSTEANALLLQADDGMREAEQEIAYAEAEVGEPQARGLREALALGKEELATAFALKQRLDDAEPEQPSEQQQLLSEIAKRSRGALVVVEDERRRLNEIRDLERTAPELLKRLGPRIPALEQQIAETEKTYERLHAYAESSWAPVRGNVEAARAAVDTAKAHLAEGTSAMALDDRRTVARSALAAQAALAQAESLLGAIESTERSLLELQRGLTADLAAAEKDIVAARKVVEGGAESFEDELRDADSDLRAAHALAIAPKPDLVTAARFVARASAAANAIRSSIPGEDIGPAREEELLQSSLRDAEVTLRQAQGVAGARRDGLSAGARARLAQAERTLGLARKMAERESRSTAIVAARQAEALARAAAEPRFEHVRLGFTPADYGEAAGRTEAALRLAGSILRSMGLEDAAHAIPTVVVDVSGGKAEE
jgi:uncharacterized membrane protein YgcG